MILSCENLSFSYGTHEVLRKVRFVRSTTAVLVGSILYKTCIQAAMSMGVPANMMKLVTALLFLLVLVLSGRKGEEIIRA